MTLIIFINKIYQKELRSLVFIFSDDNLSIVKLGEKIQLCPRWKLGLGSIISE